MPEYGARLLEIMRHALGISNGGPQYRNHFVTGPGSDDFEHCEAMVAAGLMTKREGGELSGGSPVYYVTPAGIEVAKGSGNG